MGALISKRRTPPSSSLQYNVGKHPNLPLRPQNAVWFSALDEGRPLTLRELRYRRRQYWKRMQMLIPGSWRALRDAVKAAEHGDYTTAQKILNEAQIRLPRGRLNEGFDSGGQKFCIPKWVRSRPYDLIWPKLSQKIHKIKCLYWNYRYGATIAAAPNPMIRNAHVTEAYGWQAPYASQLNIPKHTRDANSNKAVIPYKAQVASDTKNAQDKPDLNVLGHLPKEIAPLICLDDTPTEAKSQESNALNKSAIPIVDKAAAELAVSPNQLSNAATNAEVKEESLFKRSERITFSSHLAQRVSLKAIMQDPNEFTRTFPRKAIQHNANRTGSISNKRQFFGNFYHGRNLHIAKRKTLYLRVEVIRCDISLVVHPLSTIRKCKHLLEDKHKVNVSHQRWVYCGRLLRNFDRIYECNIDDDYMIHVLDERKLMNKKFSNSKAEILPKNYLDTSI